MMINQSKKQKKDKNNETLDEDLKTVEKAEKIGNPDDIDEARKLVDALTGPEKDALENRLDAVNVSEENTYRKSQSQQGQTQEEPLQNQFDINEYVDKKVYITESDLKGISGKRNFHLNKHGNMNDRGIWMPLVEALSLDYQPCKDCDNQQEMNFIMEHKNEIIKAYEDKYGKFNDNKQKEENSKESVPKTGDIGLLSMFGLLTTSGAGLIGMKKFKK